MTCAFIQAAAFTLNSPGVTSAGESRQYGATKPTYERRQSRNASPLMRAQAAVIAILGRGSFRWQEKDDVFSVVPSWPAAALVWCLCDVQYDATPERSF